MHFIISAAVARYGHIMKVGLSVKRSVLLAFSGYEGGSNGHCGRVCTGCNDCQSSSRLDAPGTDSGSDLYSESSGAHRLSRWCMKVGISVIRSVLLACKGYEGGSNVHCGCVYPV